MKWTPEIYFTNHWLGGKLWYLQHNGVGYTIVHHQASKIAHNLEIQSCKIILLSYEKQYSNYDKILHISQQQIHVQTYDLIGSIYQ